MCRIVSRRPRRIRHTPRRERRSRPPRSRPPRSRPPRSRPPPRAACRRPPAAAASRGRRRARRAAPPRRRASRAAARRARRAARPAAPSATTRPSSSTRMRSKPSASPTSCVAHSSVASRQRARAVASRRWRWPRSSPRSGSSSTASRTPSRCSARARRTRWPSPPDSSPPSAPSALLADARRDAVELGRAHERGDARRHRAGRDVGGQVAVPDAHLRLDPGDVRPQRGRAAAVQRAAVDRHPSVGGIGEAERQRHERRLARARRADERDVLARRDAQRRRAQDLAGGGAHGRPVEHDLHPAGRALAVRRRQPRRPAPPPARRAARRGAARACAAPATAARSARRARRRPGS